MRDSTLKKSNSFFPRSGAAAVGEAAPKLSMRLFLDMRPKIPDEKEAI